MKKAAVAPFDGVCSGDITVIAAKPDKLPPDLLPFINNDAFFDYAMEKYARALSPRVKWAQLTEYEFDLLELEEQEKLANLLWAVERTRKAYQNLLIRTDEPVKSQFVEMFEGRPDAAYQALEDCCISVSGGSTPSMKHEEYFGGDVPFIKSGDVKTDYVSSGALWLTQKAPEETTSRLIPKAQ